MKGPLQKLRRALFDSGRRRYLTALQLTGQHLLRYLSFAVVVNKRRRGVLRDLVRVIGQEEYEYRDPITEFLRCLFVDADFEGAQAWLHACEPVLDNDFFLVAAKDAFMDAARTLLFEAYCRVHSQIDLDRLAGQLGMDREATEKWIVNLIRSARLDARIDAKAGTVVMRGEAQGPNDVLLDKARGLSARTFALANTLVGILKA